jgi:cell division protease FtsH
VLSPHPPANLVNEAALRAVRLGRQTVNQEDLLISFEVVIAGTEKKGTVLTETEKKIIAYHEVGHALVAAKQKNAQPVQKITIVPHTQGALGYTMQLPEEEKFLMSREDILTDPHPGRRTGGGTDRVPYGDLRCRQRHRAGDGHRAEAGHHVRHERQIRHGRACHRPEPVPGRRGGHELRAQETAAAVDREVMEIINACFQDSVHILEENREMLDKISDYLLVKETITGQEMMAILEGRDPRLRTTTRSVPRCRA